MQTSTIHLTLTIALSLCLGYAASSSPAVGYPTGIAISTGSNPVRSAAGSIDLSMGGRRHTAVIAAPSTHDLVITDVVAGLNQENDYCDGNGVMRLEDDTGAVYIQLPVYMGHMDNAHPAATTIRAVSGFRIPAGVSLNVQWLWSRQQCPDSTYDLRYNISGYLAES